MPKLIWNEPYWDHRAEQARAAADSLRDPECKRIMVEIAASYEQLGNLTRAFRSAAAMSSLFTEEVCKQ
jgi:hypothetical protein